MILPTIFLLIILTLSYYTSLALNGAFLAIVADKLGDSTAKDLGFATPNPVMHFELINFLLFVMLGFYICPMLPINPFNIREPFRYFKIFVIYFLEIISSMFISLVSLLTCVLYFGAAKTNNLMQFFIINRVHGLFTSNLSGFDFSSFSNVIGLLLIATMYINAVMAVTILVFNFFKYVLLVGVEKNYGYIQYYDYLVSFVPFITLYLTFGFFYKYILHIIFAVTTFAAQAISSLL